MPNKQTILEYSALPKETKREMISFYLRNDRWASIERFEIECSEVCPSYDMLYDSMMEMGERD